MARNLGHSARVTECSGFLLYPKQTLRLDLQEEYDRGEKGLVFKLYSDNKHGRQANVEA